MDLTVTFYKNKGTRNPYSSKSKSGLQYINLTVTFYKNKVNELIKKLERVLYEDNE